MAKCYTTMPLPSFYKSYKYVYTIQNTCKKWSSQTRCSSQNQVRTSVIAMCQWRYWLADGVCLRFLCITKHGTVVLLGHLTLLSRSSVRNPASKFNKTMVSFFSSMAGMYIRLSRCSRGVYYLIWVQEWGWSVAHTLLNNWDTKRQYWLLHHSCPSLQYRYLGRSGNTRFLLRNIWG